MYKVKLENFSGPLDLLLYFIRRDKVDIYDIPISSITKEYMDTLEMLENLNLNIAGEFILMAATLMRIKAKMLLPKPEFTDLHEESDPRAELVQQLIEYQRFKEMSFDLKQLAEKRSYNHPRGMKMKSPEYDEDISEHLKDVTIFEIASIFKKAMENMPVIHPYELHREEIHLDVQKAMILKSFDMQGSLKFSSLLDKLKSKIEIVVTFLAILELVRMRKIVVIQSKVFGEMEMQKIEAEA
jgi:segregation and condensation protein A